MKIMQPLRIRPKSQLEEVKLKQSKQENQIAILQNNDQLLNQMLDAIMDEHTKDVKHLKLQIANQHEKIDEVVNFMNQLRIHVQHQGNDLDNLKQQLAYVLQQQQLVHTQQMVQQQIIQQHPQTPCILRTSQGIIVDDVPKKIFTIDSFVLKYKQVDKCVENEFPSFDKLKKLYEEFNINQLKNLYSWKSCKSFWQYLDTQYKSSRIFSQLFGNLQIVRELQDLNIGQLFQQSLSLIQQPLHNYIISEFTDVTALELQRYFQDIWVKFDCTLEKFTLHNKGNLNINIAPQEFQTMFQKQCYLFFLLYLIGFEPQFMENGDGIFEVSDLLEIQKDLISLPNTDRVYLPFPPLRHPQFGDLVIIGGQVE